MRVQILMILDGELYTPENGDTVTATVRHAPLNAARREWVDPEPILVKTVPTDTLIWELEPEDTEDLKFGTYAYDIRVVYGATGIEDTFVAGALVLTPEAPRSSPPRPADEQEPLCELPQLPGLVGEIQGARGPAGPTGPQGPTGPMGPMGQDYLPIAQERVFGSLRIPFNVNIQGMTSFVDADGEVEGEGCEAGDEYLVIATPYSNGYDQETYLYLYNCTKDTIVKKVATAASFGSTEVETSYRPEGPVTAPCWGHHNGMAYCPVDHKIYAANLTYARIDIYDVNLETWEKLDLWTWGDSEDWTDPEAYPEVATRLANNKYYLSQLAGIAWSDTDQCFWIQFRAPRLLYRVSQDFTQWERVPVESGSMTRQGIHVERETGNILQIKFRTASGFQSPPANRLEVRDTRGQLVAMTYTMPTYELESVTQLADGHFIFAYYDSNIYAGRNIPAGDIAGRRHAVLLTVGTISPRVGLQTYATYPKNFINQSDYRARTNNVYYQEDPSDAIGANGIQETGGNPEVGGKPFKCWCSVLAFLHSNTTKRLNVHLLSDLTWPLRLYNYERNIVFYGDTEPIPDDPDPEEEISGDDVLPDDEGGSDANVISGAAHAAGDAQWSIRDVIMDTVGGYVRFDNLILGGIQLKLARMNKVFLRSCTLYKTDSMSVRQGIYATEQYDGTQDYAAGSYVIYDGFVRQALVDVPAGETWTEAHWLQTYINAGHYKGYWQQTEAYEAGDKVVVQTESGEYYYNALEDIPAGAPWDETKWEYINSAWLDGDSWADCDLLAFSACDFTHVGSVDLQRTRLTLLKDTMAYGVNTRLTGTGGSYRLYENTTEAEQYACRGQSCFVHNLDCTELTKISQLRMNMQFSVTAESAANMTDLPFAGSFTGRAEVLSNLKMRYLVCPANTGVIYSRIVLFTTNSTDGRYTAIRSDSGWRAETTVPAPASASAAGMAGDISADEDYLYVCVTGGAAGEAAWKRVALSDWT